MLTSLLRPRRRRRRIDYASPFVYSPEQSRDRRGRAEQTSEDEDAQDDDEEGEETEAQDVDDGDEDDEYEPLLPIFSAAHLDTIPVYATTHAIRLLIVQKCETTLSWEQLRSPQVSQFMVKPIQQQIRADHFNRATLLALIANCLQFGKEAETNPGNAGVNKTRAILAELLAMRLLREYSTRELIDALSYDFNPLQGMDEESKGPTKSKPRGAGARISTVEISIRATAKKFLAHPLVVQQLEAIWAGSIVFHSAADNLHRKPAKSPPKQMRQIGYGTVQDDRDVSPGARAPVANGHKNDHVQPQVKEEYVRRSVTLYDPREASLFKLSRLRVPRYRQLFSTLSFAVMLILFLAVLMERSLEITTLEIVFWLYSAGYMLDEVVGFTEQGFGLYILSVWNAFDLGILFMFCIYYVLRLYGIVIADDRKHSIAHTAYDVLASTAVLLFPRAFSVLDHYRYFSQLLIAFRMMAQDMVAILILIIISCSGFFVAFTLAYTPEDTQGGHVAYALFQIVMGFSPAAWAQWDSYNTIGRIVLVFFLIICHFLVITILITVLTNSFMAIVKNANEEHQFLFAVNAISMVKSDALFSYIPPTNILSWIVSPVRFIIPFRQYVKLNRTIIKATHFPILFSIFVYERLVLSNIAYDPTDLIERSGAPQANPVAFQKKADSFHVRTRRLREPSVVSFRKDQALDEVFKRPFRGSTVRTSTRAPELERRQSSNVVDHWMQTLGADGLASPPLEQPQSVLDRLERRRPLMRRAMTSDRIRTMRRDFSTATRSVISDPEDRSQLPPRRPKRIEEEPNPDASLESIPQVTDAEDGDDELLTQDEAGDDINTVEQNSQPPNSSPARPARKDNDDADGSPDYFSTPVGTQPPSVAVNNSTGHPPQVTRASDQPTITRRSKNAHDRTVSTNTILFQPQASRDISSSSEAPAPPPPARNSRPPTRSGLLTPAEAPPQSSGYRTPRHQPAPQHRPRPIFPARGTHQSATATNTLGIAFAPQQRRAHREPSFNAIALDLASEIGDNRFPSIDDVGGISGMPASFSEQMLRERELSRRLEDERRRSEAEGQERLSRVVLSRMNTLEEGFREVLGAVREMRNGPSRTGTGSEGTGTRVPPGLGIKGKGVDSAGSSSVGPASVVPRTPGGGKSVVKEKRSPKKIRRPGWGRGESKDEGTGPIAGVTPASEVVAVDDGTPTGGSPELQQGEGETGKGEVQKTERRDGSSSGSVKSIVQNLERRQSQRVSTGSGSQLKKSETIEHSPRLDTAVDPDDEQPRTAVATDGDRDEEAQQGVVGSRRPRQEGDEDLEGKRGSVIYVGRQDGAGDDTGK